MKHNIGRTEKCGGCKQYCSFRMSALWHRVVWYKIFIFWDVAVRVLTVK